MKKIISLILALSLLLSLGLSVYGEECSHSYQRSSVAATCIEKYHLLYTCRLCGHSYKKYGDEYSISDSFSVLASSTREGSTLTVTLEIFNSPGLSSARIPVKYNADTLAVREIINGDIWDKNEIMKIDLSKNPNPFGYLAEDKDLYDGPNYKSGLFFTVVFDILDEAGDYGISFPYEAGDFPTVMEGSTTIIKNKPTFINIVGRSELRPHSYEAKTVPPTCTAGGYDLYTCTVCSDEYRANPTPTAEHSFELSHNTKEPTVFEEGEALYICTACNAEETRTVPTLVRYKKGDINNDGAHNALDSNLMKRILVKLSPTPQQKDAADVVEDGLVNAKDSFALRRIIAGQ